MPEPVGGEQSRDRRIQFPGGHDREQGRVELACEPPSPLPGSLAHPLDCFAFFLGCVDEDPSDVIRGRRVELWIGRDADNTIKEQWKLRLLPSEARRVRHHSVAHECPTEVLGLDRVSLEGTDRIAQLTAG